MASGLPARVIRTNSIAQQKRKRRSIAQTVKRSNSAENHKNKDDDQEKSNAAVQPMAKSVSGPTPKSSKATEQKYDEYNE
jgi:hypothetical protein